jgi:hypothetical protein
LRPHLGTILGRAVVILAGIVLFGLTLKLLAEVFKGILPSGLLQILSAGWDTLFGLLQPALGPLVALLILGACIWLFVRR